MPIWNRSSVPEEALALIKDGASCSLTPYVASDGSFRIGWGSKALPNGNPVPDPAGPDAADAEISQRQADALLERDIAASLKVLGAAVWVPIQECQAGALLAFLHAEGPGALINSPVMYALNQGRAELAGRQIQRWCLVPGETEGDMVISLAKARRRFAETEVFRGVDPEIAGTRAAAKTEEQLAALKQAADDEAGAFAQAELERQQGGANG